MTDETLGWWGRVGLAFSVFFRVLFNARFATSLDRWRLGAGDGAPALDGAAGAGVSGAPAGSTAEPAPDSALLLLSLLQTEGRFVDFVLQDVTGYPDAEVGAVARVVHAGCRKVLASHLRIEAIRAEPEGQPVALEPGFDPSRIKLTGRVAGEAPLRGVLRHRGWQATDVRLPSVIDRAGSRVLCPAEVEV